MTRPLIVCCILMLLLPQACKQQSQDKDNGQTSSWLYTQGNKIYQANGQVWQGRGANLHDTRGCNACTWSQPDVNEVKRRIDLLVDGWGANFIRLCLESYASRDGRVHWQNIHQDSAYLNNIKEIVAHIGTKTNVMVLLSLWHDPSFSDLGWPTSETIRTWEELTADFINGRHVIFGIVNEPQRNYSGSQNTQCWQAMNDAVAAIRAVEEKHGGNKHLIAVQGLGGWSRFLQYYVDHPITAGGGENIVYEVHVYDPASEFPAMVTNPAQSLPVIIGEFGPGSQMSSADCRTLMELADSLQIPYLGWTFHMRCPPNLLKDFSNGGCGRGMTLEPTAWGRLLQEFLNQN